MGGNLSIIEDTQAPVYVEILMRGKGLGVTQRGMAAGEAHTFGGLGLTWYTVVFTQGDKVVEKHITVGGDSVIRTSSIFPPRATRGKSGSDDESILYDLDRELLDMLSINDLNASSPPKYA